MSQKLLPGSSGENFTVPCANPGKSLMGDWKWWCGIFRQRGSWRQFLQAWWCVLSQVKFTSKLKVLAVCLPRGLLHEGYAKKSEGAKILPYLQASRFDTHCFLNTGRIPQTPGMEREDSFWVTVTAVMQVSVFLILQAPIPQGNTELNLTTAPHSVRKPPLS